MQDHGWRETWHAEAEDRPCLQCVLCIYIYIYINFCLAQDLQWPDPDYHADADGGNGTWQAEDLRSSVSHDPLTFIYIYICQPL